MEYRRSEYMGNYNVDEVFVGTPQEIIELMNGMNREEAEGDLVYDIDEAVEYIDNNIVGLYGDTKVIIREMLELEEAYMRIKGIIED